MDPCNLNEYLKLVDVIHDYDQALLTVKGWGVTLSLAAIGLGFKEKTWGYFLVAAISGIAFWGIEYSMKGYQMQYYPGMRAIEVAQHNNKECKFPPNIDFAWVASEEILSGKKPKESINDVPELRGEYKYYRWYRRIWVTSVPHAFSLILGLIFTYLSYFRVGRFNTFES